MFVHHLGLVSNHAVVADANVISMILSLLRDPWSFAAPLLPFGARVEGLLLVRRWLDLLASSLARGRVAVFEPLGYLAFSASLVGYQIRIVLWLAQRRGLGLPSLLLLHALENAALGLPILDLQLWRASVAYA